MREIDKDEYSADWCPSWCTKCKIYGTMDCESCGAPYTIDKMGVTTFSRPTHFMEEDD